MSDTFKCDGEVDCLDASDESAAECKEIERFSSCPEGEFKCRGSAGGPGGGRCILMRYRCDSDNDCGNWSDEEDCPRKTSR